RGSSSSRRRCCTSGWPNLSPNCAAARRRPPPKPSRRHPCPRRRRSPSPRPRRRPRSRASTRSIRCFGSKEGGRSCPPPLSVSLRYRLCFHGVALGGQEGGTPWGAFRKRMLNRRGGGNLTWRDSVRARSMDFHFPHATRPSLLAHPLASQPHGRRLWRGRL